MHLDNTGSPSFQNLKYCIRETDTKKKKKIITILGCRTGTIKTYGRAIDPNLGDERRLLGEKSACI